MGWPVDHSRSPLLHGYWLDEMGLRGTYEKVAVAPADIDQFFSSLVASDYVGGNVTVPHKETAYHLVDERDAIAQALGAVNTLWIHEDKIYGSNTDGYGFTANLDEYAPQWRDGKTAIVLGAGGAARAVAHAIGEAEYENIYIINRTISKAEELADKFGKKYQGLGWSNAPGLLSSTDLLVNTTSLGMDDKTDFPIDLSNLNPKAIVTDIVYTPLETPLLKMAKGSGFTCVDGLGMLLHQAVPGFEKWFGERPEVTSALRSHVLASFTKDTGNK